MVVDVAEPAESRSEKFRAKVSGLGFLGFGFRFPCFGMRDAGFRIWDSRSGFRLSGMCPRVPGSGFRFSSVRVLCFGLRALSAGVQASGLGFRALPLGCQGPASGIRVSGMGYIYQLVS